MAYYRSEEARREREFSKIRSALLHDLQTNSVERLYSKGTPYLPTTTTSDPARRLFDALKSNSSVKTINIGGSRMGAQGAKYLAEALMVNSNVHTVTLGHDNDLGAEGIRNLVAGLQVNTAVHTLSFDDCDLGAEGVHAIADMLRVNTTLRVLHISEFIMDVAGHKYLADALLENSTLVEIGIDSTLNNELVEPWASAMKTGKMSVKKVGLGCRNYYHGFGDFGANLLAEGLRANATLVEINLHGNNIGPCGARCLANALRTNSTLKKIDLSYNGLGDVGVGHIAELLRVNSTLEEVNLTTNGFSDEGLRALLNALSENLTVCAIRLSSNGDRFSGDILREIWSKLQVNKERMESQQHSVDNVRQGAQANVAEGAAAADAKAKAKAKAKADLEIREVETGGDTAGKAKAHNTPQSACDLSTLQYDLTARLGAGAVGTVYRGRCGTLAVAVKEFDVQGDADKAAFDREVRILTKLSDTSKHIVHMFGATGSGPHGMAVIVMELMSSTVHRQYIVGERAALKESDEEFRRLYAQMATGLAYLHSQNVAHRDLKPANVLLDEDGDAFLTDFGMSKVLKTVASKSTARSALGTYGFNAPEMVDRKRIKERGVASDVWSFACVLVAVLNKEKNMYALYDECESDMDYVQAVIGGEKPRLPAVVAQQSSDALKLMLDRCWALNTAKRPTMQMLLEHPPWSEKGEGKSGGQQAHADGPSSIPIPR